MYCATILLWRAVENPSKVGRTPWSAAGPLASLPRIFIALGGPQGHADRLQNLRPIVKNRPAAAGLATVISSFAACRYARPDAILRPIGAPLKPANCHVDSARLAGGQPAAGIRTGR